MCFIVNICSAGRIELSSRLSPSDWAHLPNIVKKVGPAMLRINTEVDLEELEGLDRLMEVVAVEVWGIEEGATLAIL